MKENFRGYSNIESDFRYLVPFLRHTTMSKHHFFPILAVFGRFFVKMADLIWLKFYKTPTKYAIYHPLPCIKISRCFHPFNTLNLYENLEKKTIFGRFFPIAFKYRLIPAEIMVGQLLTYFRTFPDKFRVDPYKSGLYL